MRHLCASAVVVVLVLGMLGPPLSVGQMTAASSPGAAGTAPAVGGGSAQRFLYLGAESCGASTCHGSAAPRNAPRTGIRQTEYAQWLNNDKHAKAFEVLLKERFLLMAKNLKMTEPPAKSERLSSSAIVSMSQRSCEGACVSGRRWLVVKLSQPVRGLARDPHCPRVCSVSSHGHVRHAQSCQTG